MDMQPGPLFDLMGFRMWADAGSTYLSSPTQPPGGGTPGAPAVDGRYTVISVGMAGASLFLDGEPWAFFPAVRFTGAESAPARFYSGNGSTVLYDLQIYSRPLNASEAAALSIGAETSC